MSFPQQTLGLTVDTSDPIVGAAPVQWAIGRLGDALAAAGVPVQTSDRLIDSRTSLTVLVAGPSATSVRSVLLAAGVDVPSFPEALALVPTSHAGRPVMVATGSDARGLVYAVLELADRVEHAADPVAALQLAAPIVERPANPIRGTNRLFVSDVEDLPWFLDRLGWLRYLDMLATNRFNRFHLAFGIGHDFLRGVLDAYLLFAYPFLLDVPGYDVQAVDPKTGQPLSSEEQQRNLDILRFVSDEAAARGIHFQLGIWTHGYAWTESPDASHEITGLTPENHAAYCRDALRAVLQACPGIAGVTLRVHGESGVTEGNEGFWAEVFKGAATCGRPLELDLHPKGVDRPMIDVAVQAGLPVHISPKYTAEHMGLPGHQLAIRPTEHRPDVAAVGAGDHFVENLMNRSAFDLRYTRYGYADFLPEDRPYGVFYRIWPGTQRLLLWGDPALAAGYGREGTLAGCLGVEVMEPLSFKGRRGSGLPGGRTAYADASLAPTGGDWTKYAYTFRLFGRLLYNPDTHPEVWQRALAHEFGAGAEHIERALASASRVLPLLTSAHMPSAANNRFWPEVYTNMPIVERGRPNPYRDTPDPKRFGTVSPHDPGLFSTIEEYADQIVAGQRDGRYSPIWVASTLDALVEDASAALSDAFSTTDQEATAFRRLAFDVSIQAALGRFFAAKLRAGVGYALWKRTGELSRLRQAVEAYELALVTWADTIEFGQIYRDDITVGGEPFLRGHWQDRQAAIEDDLGDMQAELSEALAASQSEIPALPPLSDLEHALPAVEYTHTSPVTIERGQPLQIELFPYARDVPRLTVTLRCRRLNQAEQWQSVEMVGDYGRFVGTIPASLTDSPFPVQYYFELRDQPDRAWLYPGLNATFSNRPYFVVRQS